MKSACSSLAEGDLRLKTPASGTRGPAERDKKTTRKQKIAKLHSKMLRATLPPVLAAALPLSASRLHVDGWGRHHVFDTIRRFAAGKTWPSETY
jgi:hypothetical protein